MKYVDKNCIDFLKIHLKLILDTKFAMDGFLKTCCLKTYSKLDFAANFFAQFNILS